jgi:hypothetical protein
VFYKAPEGSMGFNRAIAMLRDGSILFNGPDRLMKFNFASQEIEPTRTSFGESPGMRSATRESSDGYVYGVTHKTTELFRYSTKTDELKLLGKVFLSGGYTTVIELSPDEKYVYFLPGAHGKAFNSGTPIVRYEVATGRQTVLAFLAPYCEKALGYIPGGTYGMKVRRRPHDLRELQRPRRRRSEAGRDQENDARLRLHRLRGDSSAGINLLPAGALHKNSLRES